MVNAMEREKLDFKEDQNICPQESRIASESLRRPKHKFKTAGYTFVHSKHNILLPVHSKHRNKTYYVTVFGSNRVTTPEF